MTDVKHTARTLAVLPEFLAAFPSTPNRDLAARYGCTVGAVEQAGHRAKLKKTRERRTLAGLAGAGLEEYTDARLAIKALAQKHRRGLRQAFVVSKLHLDSRLTGRTLGRLTTAGELFRVDVKGEAIRWFATAEWAEEYRSFMAADRQLSSSTKPAPVAVGAPRNCLSAPLNWAVTVGRDAPRVASVFDFGSGVTR